MQAVVTAALGAGLVAIGITMVVERFGGRLGGLLATLPTTIVPACLGIWAVQAGAVEAYATAMGSVVVGMVADTAVLYAWRAVPPRVPHLSRAAQAAVTATVGLLAWAGVAGAWRAAVHDGGTLGTASGMTVGLVALGVQLAIGLGATWRGVPAPRATRRVPLWQLAARGGLAALAIGLATTVASLGHPVLGGMLSVFPAIFLTTMLSLFLAHGEALPAGAAGPMMLGSASVSVFALLSILTFPVWGPGVGTVIAWGGAVLLASVPAAGWLRARRSPTPTA